jgi:hypothetical protein
VDDGERVGHRGLKLHGRVIVVGSGVLATAAHPGAASTDAIANSGGSEGVMMRTTMRLFGQTPAEAARAPELARRLWDVSTELTHVPSALALG